MKDKELKELLRSVGKQEIDSKRKEDTIRQVLAAGNNLRGMSRISIWQRMYTMAGYLSPWLWIIQAAIVVCCAYFVADIGKSILPTVASVVPLLVCIGFVEIQKGFACGMQELESVCRYDGRQVVLLKMMLIGSVDILVTFFLLVYSTEHGVALPQAVLCILVPYLLSCAMYFTVLLRTDRRASNVALFAAGIFLALVFQFVLGNVPPYVWAKINGNDLWALAVTVVSAALLLVAVRKFWKRIDREDTKIWSFD